MTQTSLQPTVSPPTQPSVKRAKGKRSSTGTDSYREAKRFEFLYNPTSQALKQPTTVTYIGETIVATHEQPQTTQLQSYPTTIHPSTQTRNSKRFASLYESVPVEERFPFARLTEGCVGGETVGCRLVWVISVPVSIGEWICRCGNELVASWLAGLINGVLLPVRPACSPLHTTLSRRYNQMMYQLVLKR